MRSLLFFALLLVVFDAAQTATNATWNWDDVLYSYIYNVSTVKMCAVDAPTKCVGIIRLNTTNINPNKTIVITLYPSVNVDVITEYSLLQMVTSATTLSSANIYLPRDGILYASNQFSANGITSIYAKLCDSHYYYIIPVTAGYYTVKNVNLPLYLMDNKTCISYKVIAPVSNVANLTSKYATIAVFEMPTARRRVGMGFNGTQHLYYLQVDQYFGRGFYIANGTRVPVIAAQRWYIYHGPIHFSAIGKSQLLVIGGGVIHSMGWTPGDGVIAFWTYQQFNNMKGEIFWFGDGFGGYLRQEVPYRDAGIWREFVIYAPRYSLVDVTLFDGTYFWNTRMLACGMYGGETATTGSFNVVPSGFLYRVDQASEVEICNNSTYIHYIGAYHIYTTGSVEGYYMVDKVDPGTCRRFRWDITPDYVYFFNSTSDFCQRKITIWFTGGSFTPGWRYYVTQDRKLIRSSTPITVDGMYLQMLNQTLQLWRQQYNATVSALQQWLKQQANATQSIVSFIASQPRFVGTLKIDSSTSTWLKTEYNELQKYQVVGPAAVGGAVSVSLQAPSVYTASAAAAAVATAWAASRRSLATAAFLAGFAVLATSLFVYYLYGASVSAGLVLASVVLMSIGAAAIWFRRSED